MSQITAYFYDKYNQLIPIKVKIYSCPHCNPETEYREADYKRASICCTQCDYQYLVNVEYDKNKETWVVKNSIGDTF